MTLPKLSNSQLPTSELNEAGRRVINEKLEELRLELHRATQLQHRMASGARSGKVSYFALDELAGWIHSLTETYTVLFAAAFPTGVEGTTATFGSDLGKDVYNALFLFKAGRYKYRGHMKEL